MNRLSRRQFVVGASMAGAGLLVGCGRLPWQGQPAAKTPLVGYLSPGVTGSGADYSEAFRQGLQEHGYVEGQNIVVEYRSSEGRVERLPELAAELVHLPVDVLVAAASPSIWAAKQATNTIPTVMVMVAGPVEQGLVESLARPGGNLTGVSTLSPALAAKRVELLKTAIPELSRVAVLWPPNNRGMGLNFQGTMDGAKALQLEVQSIEVHTPDDVDSALEAVTRGRAGALIELPGLPLRKQDQIVEFAAKQRLPSMHGPKERVVEGGLMSYDVSLWDQARRAAYYVDRILKGAKPADLPVEQPMTFNFVVNLKAAQALGITFPNEIMLQVTEIIQ